MAVRAFISYSHADEKSLERLHKHLAMLRREGLHDWSDNKILPGQKVGDQIAASLANSTLFLALLSPDYLASNYCYENEFQKAQELAAAGAIRIIPIILEPCDWLSSPFSEYLAMPKDGKPISEFTNQNIAYMNVVDGLRKVIEDISKPDFAARDSTFMRSFDTSIRRPKIKQDFDTIQKTEFADQAFDVIQAYFENSCRELNEFGEGLLKAKFERMSATAFTCLVVNRGKHSAEAAITVQNTKGRRSFGDISYVFERHAENNSSQGSISVEADDYNMYLSMNSFSRGDSKLTHQQAAEALWKQFVEKAGIGYE
ncbi:toll/interleukin-1 receptor domain-containing protein [Mesorhizobium sp. M1A.F.Ca.IN.022.07.1.1]|uniref:toll/interleukin-1 receptor domain-containing protein n=1 Tax=Mesorhizobium sp. M1A.F.Ca.IN.022.07.1.1 TaxID=2496767 RepID=UPI000FC99B79|nr:toll/interleukin-1 receptor domain-containing protein [Mesorhizobium sp. M1A.F.Ca.IN.022.07.1.1]RUV91932.1 toll/interleukin-1 receptor domain-containing protein [Mesorhizobium sp. M1A.F.Ca.IN.022.07.1.1]TIS70187.1 MAG: TIR domain-containing protein [Mesorhizobium sp.]